MARDAVWIMIVQSRAPEDALSKKDKPKVYVIRYSRPDLQRERVIAASAQTLMTRKKQADNEPESAVERKAPGQGEAERAEWERLFTFTTR